MLSIIVAILMAVMVARAAFSGNKARENWRIIKTYRPIHFLLNIPVIAAVITTAVLLIDHVPFFDKNPFLMLFSAIFGGGDGDGVGNIIFAGLEWKAYALLFLPMLMFALPSLAELEEESFRKGTRDWAHGITRSVWFGLIHLIMMIPLGAAAALCIGGLWFTHQYFKGGVPRSTTYHSVYNSMLVGLIFVGLFIAA